MEKRSHRRVNVYPLCKARFQVGPRAFRHVEVIDLGEEGCRVHVPIVEGAELEAETVLDDWRLFMSGLPRDHVRARIVWRQAGPGSGKRFLDLGVAFLDPPASYRRGLTGYVGRASEDTLPFLGLTGMPD
jgi:hypothetical protein